MFIVAQPQSAYTRLLLWFLLASLALGFAGHLFYQAFYLQAEQRQQQLFAVINQQNQLQPQWYSQQLLKADAQQLLVAELEQDLAQTNHPDPKAGAEQLLAMAGELLNDEILFQQWLQEQLTQLAPQASSLEVAEQSLLRRKLMAAQTCLSLARTLSGWQLVAWQYCG